MLQALIESYRAAATVVAFFCTYFCVLALGRILKRQAGVRLGILFQIFCLTLASYVASGVYGIRASWRGYVGALCVLLGTSVVVALVDRYIWDKWFEQRNRTPIPKLLREIAALCIFLVALLLVLSFGFHAEGQLKGLLAGSGIAAVILGFAAQNLLGSLVAGISLQISRPYRVGDWLQIGERTGEVMEINWRATRLRTNDSISIEVPNNEIIKHTIINFHYPTELHAMRLRVGIDYNVRPNRVKEALFRAVHNAEGVIKDPRPKIYLIEFGESAAIYEIKYYINNHAVHNDVGDAIRTNIWYELRREKITMPFPVRTLHVERRPAQPSAERRDEARAILRGEQLFHCLSDEQIDALLTNSRMNHFGRGERLIEEGAAGDSMFVLLRGSAHVSVAKDGAPIRVGMLQPGDCFGEMSLLTGERRTATVRAERDCYVLEISKPVMGEVIRQSPDCLTQLSELLATRRLETEGVMKDAAGAKSSDKEHEYSASFLSRLRAFFEL
ncbi:MAG: mechanosensitive ion channel [Verrucomicrobia bacterium]|nr:mechanosensitive ion channel [Verrucomicrobiota bacterium]